MQNRYYLEIDTTLAGWNSSLLSIQATSFGETTLYSGANILTTLDGKTLWLTVVATDESSIKIDPSLTPYVVSTLDYSGMKTRLVQMIQLGRFRDPIAPPTIRYLVFYGTSLQDSLDQFNVVNNQLSLELGYPTSNVQNYAQPIYNPDPHVFEIALPIESRCLPYLSLSQQSSLVTYSQMITMGFF